MSTERLEAIQAVVDRVTSYQDGATEGTVEEELRSGLAAADVDISERDVTKLAEAIDDRHGSIDVDHVLA